MTRELTLRSRSRCVPFVAGLMAASLLLAACGDDSGGLSAPIPVRVSQVAAPGGLAAAEGGPMVGDAAMAWWFAGYTYEAGLGLGALPGASTGYRFVSGAEISAQAVQTVATAFGLSDTPVRGAGKESYDAMWTVGSSDGSTPALTVMNDAQGSWYFSGAWSHGGVGDTPVTDAEASRPSTDRPSSDDEWVRPAPPEGVPTEAEARERVSEILAALGEDHSRFETEVWADEWHASVTLWPVLNGTRSPMTWNFGFGGGGELQWAGGFLATPEAVGPYPLIDLAAAVERLESQFIGWGPAIGIGYPVPDVTLDVSGADADREQSDKELAVLVEVRSDLWWAYDADGTVWLLPAYRFIDAEGRDHVVPAVTDDYLVIEPVVELAEPMPVIEPAPGDTGGMDEESMEKLFRWASSDLVGMTLTEAAALAESAGATVRVARRDGEDLALTMDLQFNRINVAVEGPEGSEQVREVLFVG